MVIKTIQDLEDWAAYRKQTASELKGLQRGSAVHVSADDHTFQVNGKPWKGRIVLVGQKGDNALLVMKKSMTFRSGSFTVAGEGAKVGVKGLAQSLLTAANKTLAKMSLSSEFVAMEAPGAPAEPQATEPQAAEAQAAEPQAAEAQGTAPKTEDTAGASPWARRLRELKVDLRERLPAALAANPAIKGTLAARNKVATQKEGQGDLQGAVQALEELIAVMEHGEPAAVADAPEPEGLANDAADAPVADDVSDTEIEAEVEAGADAARQEVARTKGPILQRTKEAIGRQPDLRDEVLALARQAEQLEKGGDFAALLANYEELADLIDASEEDADPAEAAADAEAEAAADPADAAVRRVKADLLPRIRAKAAEHPEWRDELTALLRQADQLEKAGDFEAALEVFGELDARVSAQIEAAPEEDEEEAANAVDIRDWQQLRAWLRPRILAVGGSPEDLEPFFVSKQKLEFTNEGKRLRRKLVLAGARSRAMARRLVREGVKLIEAGCYLRADDNRIVAEGIKKPLRKAAAKTLKVMQVGRKLGEPEAGAEGKGSTAKPLSMMRVWSKAKQKVDASIHDVCARLRQTNEDALIDAAASMATAMDMFESDLTTALVTMDRASTEQRAASLPGVAELLEDYSAAVQSSELLTAAETNPFAPASVKRPLLAALQQITKSLQKAADQP